MKRLELGLIALVAISQGNSTFVGAASFPQQTLPQKSCENPSQAGPSDEIVALVDGLVVNRSQIDELIRPQLLKLYEQIHKLRSTALDRVITSHLLEGAAAKSGQTLEDFYAALLKSAAIQPEELEKFESGVGGHHLPLDEVEARERFRTHLLLRERNRLLKEQVDTLRKEAQISIFLHPDRSLFVPVDVDDDPSRGAPQAPVTLIEFADYRCPHCRRMHRVLQHVLAEYEGKVRLVFRDFPINDDPLSFRIAMSTECARDQGRFWEYHDLIFEYEGDLVPEALLRLASRLKLDLDSFQECLDSGKYAIEVRKDKLDGKAAGVTGWAAIRHHSSGLNQTNCQDDGPKREF